MPKSIAEGEAAEHGESSERYRYSTPEYPRTKPRNLVPMKPRLGKRIRKSARHSPDSED